MPVEALGALGVAANIVQFVDFTSRLFSNTLEVSRSLSGSTKENQELSTLTTHLQELCDRLLLPPDDGRMSRGTPPVDDGMRSLARDCMTAGEELLSALRSLEAKTGSKRSKFKSVRIALATIWAKGDIEAMTRRLESYKSLLLLKLTHQSDSYEDFLEQLESASYQHGVALQGEIIQMKKEFERTMQQVVQEFSAQLKQGQAKYDHRIDQWLEKQEEVISKRGSGCRQTAHCSESTDCLASKLSHIADGSLELATRLIILQSLLYPRMEARHSTIPNAHPKTFDWIFNITFSQWLESTGRLYWISGKPGSGKSTLMKYLVDHNRTVEHLKVWAGSRKVITASFYFWISGTEIQKSQEGLFRSLLYEVLSKCPELMPIVVPNQWKSAKTLRTGGDLAPWSQKQLVDAFTRLQGCNSSPTAFCFFIDGLDEYDGHHADLIAVLKTFATSPNIKVCLSSRSWNVFEAGFGDDTIKRINVQDYTKDDLRLYVQDNLGNRADLQELQKVDGRYHELIEEIVEKAQGVFLWVFLVVRSLVEGLENSDRIIDLQRRVQEFPSDLQAFFMHMFKCLSPTYREQTAKAFQMALGAKIVPLSVLAYWFLDWEEENGDLMTAKLSLPDKATLIKWKEIMERRLNARTKCLLEVSEVADRRAFRYCVEFLHRTVKDFMMSEDMQRALHTWTPEGFDADIAICKVVSAELRIIPDMLEHRKDISGKYGMSVGVRVLQLLDEFAIHARLVEPRTEESVGILVDLISCRVSESSKVRKLFKKEFTLLDNPYTGKRYLLPFAIDRRLGFYVLQQFDDEPGLAKDTILWSPFIRMLRDIICDTEIYKYRPTSTRVCGVLKKCLLEGADKRVLEEYVHDILEPEDAKELMHTVSQTKENTNMTVSKGLTNLTEKSLDKKEKKRSKVVSIFRRLRV